MKRFFECLIPVTVCNLKCDYCYVIQEHNRLMKMPVFQYTSSHIKQALSVERLGGICYFSICGAGETLIPKETLEITKALLENGHYVNVTNNGTMTNRIEEIVSWEPELLSRLHLAFSLHYLELLKHNMLERFFNNVRTARAAGCSVLVQINLYDGYNPYWNEIKELCISELGAAPQVAATRDESSPVFKFHTDGTISDYIKRGEEYESPLWNFTVSNFNLKHNKEFCYAGEWSGTLNLCSGEMTGCYGQGIRQNIFEDITKPIKFMAIGKHCSNKYCINSSHFLSLGCIPSYSEAPSYASLRNRAAAGWYTPQMVSFLSEKLYDGNEQYGGWKRFRSNVYSSYRGMKRTLGSVIRKIIRK